MFRLIETIPDDDINKYAMVTLKELGNISEVVFQSRVNKHCYIRKLSSDEYINLKTGEIISCNHIKNRSENIKTVRLALKSLRDYINFNVTDYRKCKWITLTYAENMTNTKKLYSDFKKFIKRFRYFFRNTFQIEYIVAMEPQSRGAWHCHLLLLFDKVPGFIDNTLIEKLWGNGFTKTKDIDSNIDNLGAYLSAYLSDFELEELPTLNDKSIQTEILNHHKGIKSISDKRFLKGARLYLYPPHFNLYRVSRGIKKPLKKIVCYGSFIEKRKKIGLSPLPIFSKSIHIKLLDNSSPIIIRRRIYKNLYHDLD